MHIRPDGCPLGGRLVWLPPRTCPRCLALRSLSLCVHVVVVVVVLVAVVVAISSPPPNQSSLNGTEISWRQYVYVDAHDDAIVTVFNPTLALQNVHFIFRVLTAFR